MPNQHTRSTYIRSSSKYIFYTGVLKYSSHARACLNLSMNARVVGRTYSVLAMLLPPCVKSLAKGHHATCSKLVVVVVGCWAPVDAPRLLFFIFLLDLSRFLGEVGSCFCAKKRTNY